LLAVPPMIPRVSPLGQRIHSAPPSKYVLVTPKADLDHYLKAFPYIPHQKGILVMIDGKIVGFDMLSLETAYEALHPKLAKSYVLYAILQQGGEADNGSADKARVFIEEAGKCKEEKFKSVGHGWDHRFEGPGVVGSALVHEQKVIHTAFFSVTESEKAGRMSSATWRRRHKV